MSKFLCEASDKLAPTFPISLPFFSSQTSCLSYMQQLVMVYTCPIISCPRILVSTFLAKKALLAISAYLCPSKPYLYMLPVWSCLQLPQSKIMSSISKHCVYNSRASFPPWNNNKATNLSLQTPEGLVHRWHSINIWWMTLRTKDM